MLVLLTGFQGSAEPREPEGYVGTYVWSMPDDAFGGFSAIELSADGTGFVALSDKAMFVKGRFQRDETGQITDVLPGPMRPLVGYKSRKPLEGRRADSEGLAITPTGEAFVSFENRTRVTRLDLETGATLEDIDPHSAFAKLPKNGALEALGAAEGPTLYAVPEDPPSVDFPVYRWSNGVWDDDLSIPRRGRFLPVSADIGPDGRFYLLERDFRGIGGFASRLRRFDMTPTGLSAEVTLFETPFALHDNLEGLSVWRDETGALRATMISDDNFVFVQQTQIVEYRLPD